MNPKKFAILFLLYLLVYLWFKSINEISFKSIEYLTSLNELLGLVIITGISYYLLVIVSKSKDVFLSNIFKINISLKRSLLVSLIASILVFAITSVKIGNWGGTYSTVSIAMSILTFFTIYYSLTDRS